MNRRVFIVAAVVGLAVALSLSPPAEAQVPSGGDRAADLTNLVKALNGSWTWLGTVRSTDGGCFNNLTNMALMDGGVITDAGNAAFTIKPGSNLVIQCDGQDAIIQSGTDAGHLPVTMRSIRVSGQVSIGAYNIGQTQPLLLKRNENVVGMCPLDGGTTNGCKVFRLE